MKLKILSFIIIFLFSFTLQAQSLPPNCGDRESVLNTLTSDRYKEKVVASGITGKGNLVEIFVSLGGETWSIVISSPQGITCLVLVGNNWYGKINYKEKHI